jgi:uncharacterized protein (DUF2126 family)
MRVRVKHHSRYTYDRPAALGPHVVRLRPAAHTRAEVLSYNLSIEGDAELRWQRDAGGNASARLTFPEGRRYAALGVTVDLALDIRPVNPFDFYVDDRCDRVPFAYPDGLEIELAPFLTRRPLSPQLSAFIEEVPFTGTTVDYLVALNQRVAQRVGYIVRNEPGLQTSDETLSIGSGSCRDSAVLLVDVLRARGLAARFVSGYLVQLTDEGIIPGEARGMAKDVVDLHAWAEVFLPGGGWIGLDGTSGLMTGEGHIPLASAVNPELAAAISGTSSEPATGFAFESSVTRLGHEPRPRRPYDDATWQAILAGGDAVDTALATSNLRLTCGGEPTWTSRTHPREPEWATEALGATKWEHGLSLALELFARLPAGALLLHGSGKQYPGEPLPRWALRLVSRNDGVPLWRDKTLLDLGGPEPSLPAPPAATADPTQSFRAALSARLEIADNWIPGYEDPRHIHDDAPSPSPRDPDRPIGYSLPLQWWAARWITGPWELARKRLYLVPGDSPMGLRLPLDELDGEAPEVFAVDPTVDQPPLAFDPRTPSRPRGAPRPQAKQPPREAQSSRQEERAAQSSVEQTLGEGTVLRTAVCLEERNGCFHVFLPPLATLEAFVDLVASIEDAARASGIRVRLEGYPPPSDARLDLCAVTPDPGVIEVNLPVLKGCREYARWLETVADAANHAGLCLEKYQLDGRESGSGGGNHLTLGGQRPLESPFLNEPHLLASLLRYLQNHPSLSYLYSGLFVGPTSQAPRIDEARLDSLDELELALAQVPPPGTKASPWLMDRLLRNLLVDVSGNTHRTEVSIDKLYTPERASGRLGLVEFRAFEMPQNERMAVVQMVLVRALIARFARQPYTEPLVRWGTGLHDRFMLPHFLWKDACDVCDDLARFGIEVDKEWIRPFVECRFPVFGTVELDGILLEIRSAAEPWPTLGEEAAGAVVARYVDSSLERLQVRAVGMTEGRHVVAVNGVELPMHPTGQQGERIAGVRFRAWQPPNCLQPNIGVHHPLRFDVVDTWGERSLGSCTYHVWHPEGRAYDEPPLTAFEAAARRAQRFTREGHAPWPVKLTRLEPHPSHPLTLDLRRLTVRAGA